MINAISSANNRPLNFPSILRRLTSFPLVLAIFFHTFLFMQGNYYYSLPISWHLMFIHSYISHLCDPIYYCRFLRVVVSVLALESGILGSSLSEAISLSCSKTLHDLIASGGETGCNALSVCCWLGLQELRQWASSGLSRVVSTSCPLTNSPCF